MKTVLAYPYTPYSISKEYQVEYTIIAIIYNTLVDVNATIATKIGKPFGC